MDAAQLLIYGLLVAGFLVFNFMLQRAAQARKRQAQAQQPEAAPPEVDLDESGWGRTPPAVLRSAAAPVEGTRRVEADAAPAPPPRRFASSALFRTKHDLRRGIIVMTVLGPCRALEPYDDR